MAKTTKKASEQLAKEAREVTQNLKEPLTGLLSTTWESAYKVFETVTAGVGELVGTIIDEGNRLGSKVRKGIDAVAE